MNSNRVKRAMREALTELRQLDGDVLRREIMDRAGGPISELLIGSGMFEGRVQEAQALERERPEQSPVSTSSLGNQQLTTVLEQVKTLYKEIVSLKSRTAFLEARLVQVQARLRSPQLANWALDLYGIPSPGSGVFITTGNLQAGTYFTTSTRIAAGQNDLQESLADEESARAIFPLAIGQD